MGERIPIDSPIFRDRSRTSSLTVNTSSDFRRAGVLLAFLIRGLLSTGLLIHRGAQCAPVLVATRRSTKPASLALLLWEGREVQTDAQTVGIQQRSAECLITGLSEGTNLI